MRRPRNYASTRQLIVDAALKEFAQHGYTAATTDGIAERAAIMKRLIFYYFKTKLLLFASVLEYSYELTRSGELELQFEKLPPHEAIRTLVEWTFEFDFRHSHFVRLVMIENIHSGCHTAKSVKPKKWLGVLPHQLKLCRIASSAKSLPCPNTSGPAAPLQRQRPVPDSKTTLHLEPARR